MKKFVLSFFILCTLFSCKAQNNLEKVSDSVAMVSRTKADEVLMCFDSLKNTKLLFSVLDKDYYVLIKNENSYKEYYIKVDSLGEIVKMHCFNLTKRENKKLSRLNPFDLQKYHSEFITSMPNAAYVRGYSSYFVVKTIRGERFGEFCLSVFTLPNPIDGKLYGYILRRLSEQKGEISNNTQP